MASSLGIYLYDAGTLEEMRFVETGAWIASVAFSPDGQTLASGSLDTTVRLWQVADGALLQTCPLADLSPRSGHLTVHEE